MQYSTLIAVKRYHRCASTHLWYHKMLQKIKLNELRNMTCKNEGSPFLINALVFPCLFACNHFAKSYYHYFIRCLIYFFIVA